MDDWQRQDAKNSSGELARRAREVDAISAGRPGQANHDCGAASIVDFVDTGVDVMISWAA